MDDKKIPKHKWMQVHTTILLSQFISHEVINNPSGIKRVNSRIQEVTGTPATWHSADTLITVSWMILARAFEIIDNELGGKNKQILYSGIVFQAKEQCSINSFSELKSRYNLDILDFPGEHPTEYQQTLWRFIKVLRDSLSHVDYQFDNSLGNAANQVIVEFVHSYRGLPKLHMRVSFSNLFQMTEHIGIWIDRAIQQKNLLEIIPADVGRASAG